MKKDSVFPKKGLGQVFLRETWPVKMVANTLLEWGVERVLEIGPGPGILTDALVDRFDLTVVEKDSRFINQLQERYEEAAIVPQDILEFSFCDWIEIHSGPAAIVGNIPYNISTPIVLRCLEHIDRLQGVILMTQREFAERVVASQGSKTYGSLSVYVQLRADVRCIARISRNCFQPRPKVDSSLVTFLKRDTAYDASLLAVVEKLTRAAFSQRRKKLRNSLAKFLTQDLESHCPIDLARRAETLSPAEFAELGLFLSRTTPSS